METKVKKLKLSDLTRDPKINQLDIDKLADVQGGFALPYGCYTAMMCVNSQNNIECSGGAVCITGIDMW